MSLVWFLEWRSGVGLTQFSSSGGRLDAVGSMMGEDSQMLRVRHCVAAME
jgi:hypothetical protein